LEVISERFEETEGGTMMVEGDPVIKECLVRMEAEIAGAEEGVAGLVGLVGGVWLVIGGDGQVGEMDDVGWR
jgi:hypothetical protein